MLTIDKENDQLVTLKLSGQLDSVEMELGLDQLIEATQGMEDGKLLYFIDEFEFPTFSALMVEMVRLPALFSMISRISKTAVVADQTWIRTLSEWEGALFPGLEIRGFAENQEEEARAWLET